MDGTVSAGGFVRVHEALEPMLVDIDSVRQYPNNPRAGDVEVISESIRKNGVYRPIYVQRSTGFILAGNHTYAASKSLNAEKIPVVYLDVDNTAAKRIVLVDNRAADAGEYDTAVLVDLLNGLAEEAGGDLAAIQGTGYDEASLKALQAINDINDNDPLDFAQWPSRSFQVHPDIWEKFYELTEEAAGDDNLRFRLLIELAGD